MGTLPPIAGLVLPAIGTPRTIVSDATTMNHLRTLLASPMGVRFKDVVDSKAGGGNPYGMEPWHVALMAQISTVPADKARYCNFAVTQTDAFIAQEELKIDAIRALTGVPVHDPSVGWVPPLPVVSGDSYLEVGPIVGNLAMVYDWCRGSMNPVQRGRWVTYGNAAVANVWRGNNTQTWGGKTVDKSDWSIDNPVNNYYYSFLEATMLLGLATQGVENPQADTWLTMFRKNKIEDQLIPRFAAELQGGGSREGTGYGTAMKNLWQLYDWWERSTGESLAKRTPHTLDSMAWMLHNIVPTRDRLAPTGDHARDEEAFLFDYHRDYLLKLMKLFPAERMSGAAKTMLAGSSVTAMSQHFMKYSDYLYEDSAIAARSLDELSTAFWGSGTGVFAMRSDWNTTASYANFLCATRSESHSHRDNGSFVLYKGGWLASDANISGKSGLEQEEKYHNLVRFENAAGQVAVQREGGVCSMQALANTPDWSYGMARMTASYPPHSVYPVNGLVAKSEREFVFIKPSTFVVFDRAQTTSTAARPIFTLNFPDAPTITGDTMRYAQGANRVDVTRLAPDVTTTTPTRWSDVNPEFRPPRKSPASTAVRVDVRDAATGTSSEFLHVFGLNGSVATAYRDDATGQTGTRITLTDGRVAVLRFNKTTPGGTLQIFTGGVQTQGGTLPTTVVRPTLYVTP